MWESICLTLAATAGSNIGKVLQKRGTVIRAYAANVAWIIGFLMDIIGALLMLKALSLAPVSVIQPVSGCGLAILSVFSHFYLKEVMNVIDWMGITLAGIGTIGVGAGGEEQEASSISIFQLPWLALLVAILFVAPWLPLYASVADFEELVLILNTPPPPLNNDSLGFSLIVNETLQICHAAESLDNLITATFIARTNPRVVVFTTHLKKNKLVVLNGWLRMYRRQRRAHETMDSEVVEEIIYGLESGILFGMASVISKMGFVFLEQGFSKMLVPLCLAISICCSATGFYYQTQGLKHGRAIVLSTCAAVASIVTGVLAGMLALGERLPSAPAARFSLLLGWLLIVVGVILLVSSSWLLRHLPQPLRNLTSSADRNFSLSRSGSLRLKDPNPTAVIHAATLHHLISSPSKEKA
ncbi:hypothetical protein POTOM_026188 [Populus tomentosa]|uniref:Probable magnesium transporter n=1 Tax=Populus tomentosa TaxID=118781 RepID=A0A8X7ZIE8_POPTO|nr:hypothetical protein POTOM_026188 [Populus tomentosa]